MDSTNHDLGYFRVCECLRVNSKKRAADFFDQYIQFQVFHLNKLSSSMVCPHPDIRFRAPTQDFAPTHGVVIVQPVTQTTEGPCTDIPRHFSCSGDCLMGSSYSLPDLKGGGLGSALRVHDFFWICFYFCLGWGRGACMHDFWGLKEGVMEMM